MSSRRKALQGIFQQSVDELAAANPTAERDVRAPAGPVKTMALSLGRMEQEARELQEALSSGQHVQELDTALIDTSIVRDRLDVHSLDENDPFVQSIATNGQEVPILVRPHPVTSGRYQAAYGHRRLAACALLGVKVRAIVRELDDTALVVAQGVENSARENLSYIERAVFAHRLEARGFARSVIMRALNTDKTELSKLISVAVAVPEFAVEAIGSARSAGRRKWMTFASSYGPEREKTLRKLFVTEKFVASPSDERLELALKALSLAEAGESPAPTVWAPDGNPALVGAIKVGGKSFSLSLKSADGARFGSFVALKLDELYAEYLTSQGD